MATRSSRGPAERHRAGGGWHPALDGPDGPCWLVPVATRALSRLRPLPAARLRPLPEARRCAVTTPNPDGAAGGGAGALRHE
eukprot:7076607-Heterocapsa_arctica.AAC.1